MNQHKSSWTIIDCDKLSETIQIICLKIKQGSSMTSSIWKQYSPSQNHHSTCTFSRFSVSLYIARLIGIYSCWSALSFLSLKKHLLPVRWAFNCTINFLLKASQVPRAFAFQFSHVGLSRREEPPGSHEGYLYGYPDEILPFPFFGVCWRRNARPVHHIWVDWHQKTHLKITDPWNK